MFRRDLYRLFSDFIVTCGIVAYKIFVTATVPFLLIKVDDVLQTWNFKVQDINSVCLFSVRINFQGLVKFFSLNENEGMFQ